MPFGMKPVCSLCRVTTSTLWRKGPQGEILCNSCGLKQSSTGTATGPGGNGLKESGQNGSSLTNSKNGNGNGNGNHASHLGGPVLRKSARIKPVKSKVQAATKALATKGKSRRIIFKKSQPVKAPRAVATVVTSDRIFHDGQYYQVGDIVSAVDHEGGVFYAQLRGFLCDQYNEKSAVLSWLLPTQQSPTDRFDASTFILGPEEDIPRKLDYLEFVCHAPSDYYLSRTAPYPPVRQNPSLCFVWTSLGPEIRTTPSVDQIFGVKEDSDDASDQSFAGTRFSRDKGREREDRRVARMEVD